MLPRTGITIRRTVLQLGRRFSSSASPPVDLASIFMQPVSGGKTDGPIVILHGLFGSKRNWNTSALAYSSALNRPIYALDLRNHGESPHAPCMSYTTMARDVSHWIEKNNLSNVTLLGHSMGGKVAMTVALSQPNLISRLVVADISPINGTISSTFRKYIKAMQELDKAKHEIRSRKDASDFLSSWETNQAIQAFLLTNFSIPGRASPNPPKWTIPINFIAESLEELGAFPFSPGAAEYTNPTLFIRGENSRYIQTTVKPVIDQLFPNSQIETIKEAGHWLHVEKPVEFQALLEQFLRREDSKP